MTFTITYVHVQCLLAFISGLVIATGFREDDAGLVVVGVFCAGLAALIGIF